MDGTLYSSEVVLLLLSIHDRLLSFCILFPWTAVTNYKLSALKQQKFVISQS